MIFDIATHSPSHSAQDTLPNQGGCVLVAITTITIKTTISITRSGLARTGFVMAASLRKFLHRKSWQGEPTQLANAIP